MVCSIGSNAGNVRGRVVGVFFDQRFIKSTSWETQFFGTIAKIDVNLINAVILRLLHQLFGYVLN